MIAFIKLLLLAGFIYALVTLVRLVIRMGRIAEERRKREDIRDKGAGSQQRKGVIEIDKDQYKVE